MRKTFLMATFLAVMGMNIGSAYAATNDTAIVHGFGKGIDLSIAVRQIVPPFVHIVYARDVDISKKVNWSGGFDWQTVLRDMASKNGLEVVSKGNGEIHVMNKGANTNPDIKKQGGSGFVMLPGNSASTSSASVDNSPIEISNVRKEVPVAQNTPVAQNAPIPLTPETRMQASQVVQPVQNIIPVRSDNVNVFQQEVWVATPGKTLQQVLEEWALKVGYKIAYTTTVQYPIEGMATYSGDFLEAVTQLVQDLSNRKPPPKAEIYNGNNTVVIKNSLGIQN